VLVLHYLWVLRADATFETAAVAASARRAARLAARTSNAARIGPRTASRPWFPLGASGPAWMAIVWKNTLNLTRGVGLSITVRVGLAIAILVITFRAAGLFGSLSPHSVTTPATITAAIALIGAGYLAFLGPLAIRNDFRQDLPYLGVLRTFPLRGRTIVLAEVMAPTLALTAVQLALLVLAYLLTLDTVAVDIPLTTRTMALAGAVIAVPLLNAVSFTIQNALTLLFPAWSRLGTTTPTGFEMMGQRLLAAFAAMVALLVALVPPTAAALFAGWVLHLAWRTSGLVPVIGVAVLAGAATAVVELTLACGWLGHMYDHTDVTALST
jgi:hypothetical protein